MRADSSRGAITATFYLGRIPFLELFERHFVHDIFIYIWSKGNVLPVRTGPLEFPNEFGFHIGSDFTWVWNFQTSSDFTWVRISKRVRISHGFGFHMGLEFPNEFGFHIGLKFSHRFGFFTLVPNQFGIFQIDGRYEKVRHLCVTI